MLKCRKCSGLHLTIMCGKDTLISSVPLVINNDNNNNNNNNNNKNNNNNDTGSARVLNQNLLHPRSVSYL